MDNYKRLYKKVNHVLIRQNRYSGSKILRNDITYFDNKFKLRLEDDNSSMRYASAIPHDLYILNPRSPIKKGDWRCMPETGYDLGQAEEDGIVDWINHKRLYNLVIACSKPSVHGKIKQDFLVNYVDSLPIDEGVEMEFEEFAGILPEKPIGNGWTAVGGEACFYLLERPILDDEGYVKLRIVKN